MEEQEMPIGFAFQMALNQNAMENFVEMTEEEKKQVLEAARNVHTKEQMRSIVEDLGQLG
ncbi:MAG: hypothetical protein J6C37_09860 [Roseburia sp.]|nr:hypothetical protein [Roseburia sp.]